VRLRVRAMEKSPSTKSWTAPGETACIHGRAREVVHLEPVVRSLGLQDLDGRRKAADLHRARVSADVDPVVAVGGVDHDAIGLAVAAAGSTLERRWRRPFGEISIGR
jgi:hypothetical protein